MDITKSSGPDLLPSELPPSELIPEQLIESLNALPAVAQRVLSWTITLAAAFEREAQWQRIPGFRFVTYGFADPEFEADKFGAIVYATPMPGIRDDVSNIKVGRLEFPIFVRRPIEILHSLPNVHPLNGTAGCWATSSKLPSSRDTGFLTAKHVLQPQVGAPVLPGSPVPTTHGYGTVLDVGPDGIDAALVKPSSASPSLGNRIPVIPYPYQWMDVSFCGRSSSSVVTTKVIEVSGMQAPLSPFLPSRICLAAYGQQGDSGALVETNTGDGVGIYGGRYQDPSGATRGWAQHLAQACNVMGLSLYS